MHVYFDARDPSDNIALEIYEDCGCPHVTKKVTASDTLYIFSYLIFRLFQFHKIVMRKGV